MPMRKYHFNGPLDLPRFIILLLALVVIAFAGMAILTIVAFAGFAVLLPVLLWERLKQAWHWVIRRKEA